MDFVVIFIRENNCVYCRPKPLCWSKITIGQNCSVGVNSIVLQIMDCYAKDESKTLREAMEECKCLCKLFIVHSRGRNCVEASLGMIGTVSYACCIPLLLSEMRELSMYCSVLQ